MVHKHAPPVVLSAIGESIGAVFTVLILRYIVPVFPFVTGEYDEYLPLGMSAAILTAMIRIIYHLTRSSPFSRFFIVCALGVSMYSVYVLSVIFPFDFGSIGYVQMQDIVRVAVYLILFGLGVAFVAELITLISLQQTHPDHVPEERI